MKKRFFKGNFFLKFLSAKLFALFCILAFSAGNAWAGYYKGRAVANVEGLAEAKKGTVKVLATTNWYEGNEWEKDASSTISTTDALDDWEDWGWGLFYSVTLYASNAEGAYFGGWYSDEECTILISTANPFSASEGFSSAATEEAAPITTFYAKFVTTEPTNHYAQIQYVTDNQTPKRGAFAYLDPYTWETSYIYERWSTDLSDLNTQTTYTHTNNEVRVIPLRGYRFTSWILTGANAAYSPDYGGTAYGATDNPTYINISSSSNDELNPEVATIQAGYAKLNALTLTMRKAAGKGRATVRYENYEENAGGDGLELKTVSMGEFALANTEKQYTVYESDQITVTAEPASGYSFYGWYSVNSTTGAKTLVTTEAEFTFQPNGNEIYYAYFDTPITAADKFQVGMSLCQTIEQALAAVNETDKLILQVNNYTIDGNYTIPAGVTLLIPRDADQKSSASPMSANSSDNTIPSDAYCTLTLAAGATLNVLGEIEVGGTQNIYGTGATGTGRPNGSTYGQIIMQSGSEIILNNGSKLRAWGFVTGEGEIDARRGSRVEEMFQLYDFKGGWGTANMQDNSYEAFPVNQYFIQNIEVPTKYRPGAALYGAMAAVNTGVVVKIIGIETDGAALFKMKNNDDSEDTWVRKFYDASTDQQVYEINNKAALSNLELDMGMYGTFNSAAYKLPITNNMKIHLLSGDMEITQSTVLLPGAEIEVNKLSTVNILAGKGLYLYDTDQWGNYVYSSAYASKIKYRPGGLEYNRNISSAAALGDAQLNIHGTVVVNGALYTTESGANIYSSNADAGTIKFETAAPTGTIDLGTWTHQTGSSYDTEPHYTTTACPSAKLKNETGDPRTTAGTAAGRSFCYFNGSWHDLEQESDCFAKDGTKYYAKPKDYVELKSGEEDENHLYYSADETRTFITTLDGDGNCQWWEVEPAEDGLMHCIHPENDVYYFYDEDSESETYQLWQEKKFKVSWVNWDGSPVNYTNADDEVVNYYMVTYGTVPQWLSANPTRANDASHEYSFAGWAPDLAPVTADVTYMATYQERDRMYSITFNDESGELIQLLYCKLGEIPVCDKYDAAANGKEWKTVDGEQPIGAVSKNEVYKLFTKDVVGPFTIRFVNWNGEELLAYDQEEGENAKIIAGNTPAYNGATPIKPADNSHAYTFVGWTPSIGPATQNMTYTAKFEVQQLTGLNVVDAQTITSDLVIPDVRISTTGSLNVTGSITANNFYLESNGSTASGQIVGGEGNITADHIYFDFKVNAKNHKWYGVAVPWPVSATNGISVNGKTLVLGKDFDIVYYNGAQRAEVGKQKCWSYVEDDGDKTLQPGRLYMIGLMMDAPTIRFAKKSGAALLTTSTSVTAHPQTTGDDKDANWNGVANPALFHAFVNAGALVGQVYNPETNSYDEIPMNTTKMVVGQGAFVQAPSNKAITVAYGGAYAAPRRARAEEAPLYDVRIAPAEAEYTDRLFVRVEDEKEADTYVIGKDLAKLGVSKSVAQMWINRYNTELCLNTMTMENGAAEYPLGIFAPKAGEYTITNEQSSMSNEYTLYLTFNGEAIWNLSEGAYTLELPQGNTTNYGLRVSARAPQITTGIDEAVVDAKGETRKVLIDNQVFIIRGENVYSVDGQLVK